MSSKLILASTVVFALTAAMPAQAAKSQGEQAVESIEGGGGASAGAKEERKTCRNFDNSASRMKRQRICMTREQWKKFEAEQAQ